MDSFREEVVVRRNGGVYSFAYIVSYAMMILLALFAITGLMGSLQQILSGNFDIVSLVVALAMGGATFLIWKNKDELKCEYEYAFTNGDLDVAKVLNNSRRKYLTSLPMKNVEACGEVANGGAFQRYLSMKDVKRHNWFLNRDAKLQFFYFTKNGVKHLMIVELSDEMVGLVRSRNYLNFGAWQGGAQGGQAR